MGYDQLTFTFAEGYELPVVAALPTGPSEPDDVLSYDRYVVFFSGGKDSVASALELLERGVPAHKIELWHHIVDGREGSTLMDWPCTNDYCRAFAEAFGMHIYFSWKHGGFEREMLRHNSRTAPISFEVPTSAGTEISTVGGTGGKESTRRLFPQVSADLSVRWCSSYTKIHVAQAALRNQARFEQARTLLVSGERAEESPNRARYTAFAPDATDARNSPRLARHMDRWMPIHQWSEVQVWDLMRKYSVNPHPAYRLGWSRCSCAGCIFNGADEFATLRRINAQQFGQMTTHETDFGRTIKRATTLDTLADQGKPFPVKASDVAAALSETWYEPIILSDWELPVGAFAKGNGPS
ncbi:Phosphoadenosine phosphosulfate reductase family protein [Hymenobacter daecheongensis DSM 21074]|uniref:Phosphoadenosine phosphosulfate reductase family protein n=1 Tax=Hymenobacter daecheongensis DSM 21074 TaxID=1121955 RepID=A0A1M6LW73_9BACT|nr:phosphoadenosine phosphosulfate reductase family protein [Hymenobacter daecheongensis]SHJ75415.1 Phosphoadenosine phosphosulfate reductase family protein [Hymenobacter daecheongensis DSM 21074]